MHTIETIATLRATLTAFVPAPADVEDRARGIALCDIATDALRQGDTRGRYTAEGAAAVLRDLQAAAVGRAPRPRRQARPVFLRGAALREHMVACRSLHCRICM